ncbi:MAG: hypothetical protein L6R38_005441 [Xanthoria sp. 2 TBL-2021]|nr:MAG: hypothetical protein L6R38_005441 [Xanthoria sp. 2 TBL-2021]
MACLIALSAAFKASRSFVTLGRVRNCPQLQHPRFACLQNRHICSFSNSSSFRIRAVKSPFIGYSQSCRRPEQFHNARLSTTSQTLPPASKPPDYRPPRAGLISSLPASWIPYAELARLDKPAGTYYLFFPCLFSTLMAASYTHAPPLAVLETCALFFTGALIMRGAGCTINDLWDRNLDPYVARTRLRPLARQALTPFRALTFTGFQLLAGLGLLLQFPTPCLYYGIPSLILVATYPLAKRITHYPQFVLGLAFSWGAFMGFPALGVDLMSDQTASKGVMALYASCVSWTVLYDMIYAHMDIKDDAKVGIKSIALRHEKETKAVLSGLAVAQTTLLFAAGALLNANPLFLIGTSVSTAATLGLMIWKVRLKHVSSCWWWFKYGAWFTGGGVSLGLLAEYIFQRDGNARQMEVPPSAWRELIYGHRPQLSS